MPRASRPARASRSAARTCRRTARTRTRCHASACPSRSRRRCRRTHPYPSSDVGGHRPTRPGHQLKVRVPTPLSAGYMCGFAVLERPALSSLTIFTAISIDEPVVAAKVEAREFADAPEPLPQRVGMDVQRLRGRADRPVPAKELLERLEKLTHRAACRTRRAFRLRRQSCRGLHRRAATRRRYLYAPRSSYASTADFPLSTAVPTSACCASAKPSAKAASPWQTLDTPTELARPARRRAGGGVR